MMRAEFSSAAAWACDGLWFWTRWLGHDLPTIRSAGRYVVFGDPLADGFAPGAQAAVVDDFGNLVAVPA